MARIQNLDPNMPLDWFESLRKWNPRYVRYAEAHGNTPEAQAVADEAAYPGGRMTGFIVWTHEAWQAWKALRGLPAAAVLSDAQHADFDLWLVKRAQYSRYRERHRIEPVPTERARGIIGGSYVCATDQIRVYRRAVAGGWTHSEEAVRELRQEANPVGWPK